VPDLHAVEVDPVVGRDFRMAIHTEFQEMLVGVVEVGSREGREGLGQVIEIEGGLAIVLL
jgi:hypothetical protein